MRCVSFFKIFSLNYQGARQRYSYQQMKRDYNIKFKTKIEIELLLLLQKKIRQATNQLKQIKSKLLGYINVKYDGKTLDFLTGITNDSLFPWIL